MKIPNYKEDVHAAAERLSHFAEIEGSELGEMWERLSSLYIGYCGYFTAEFEKDLEAEIVRQAILTHTDFRVVTEKTEQIIKRTETYLERI